ncbi:MAG: hypothetical protein QXK43_04670 [Candidatus Jordarchaeales archaeon]
MSVRRPSSPLNPKKWKGDHVYGNAKTLNNKKFISIISIYFSQKVLNMNGG